MKADVTQSRAKKFEAPILSLDDIWFSYFGGEPVLTGVSLDVMLGTVTCLMGVNGCGKSTLIDVVLGYQRPTSGTIMVNGRNAKNLRPLDAAKLIAYVPQVHERSFPYTVEHIVLLGRTAKAGSFSAPGADDREAAHDALKLIGMEQFAERSYTSLSGGEMQMVLLARALAQDTPLVLMDEPTAHLDFKNELLFLETLEHLVSERRTTVLMATHSPNQAFHLANSGIETKVAVMDQGRIEAVGYPKAILTPELLARVFNIEGFVTSIDVGGEGGRPVDQLVLQRTMKG